MKDDDYERKIKHLWSKRISFAQEGAELLVDENLTLEIGNAHSSDSVSHAAAGSLSAFRRISSKEFNFSRLSAAPRS